MEVHHHPDIHHNKKKWKEYLLEFLMIFLAVTMGFFAENIREHFTGREKEKQAMEGLIKCLAGDTAQLATVIKSNDAALEQLKSSGMLRLVNKENIIDRQYFWV